MGRANRTLLWALAISLLLHFLTVSSLGNLWSLPSERLDFPIEARLTPPAARTPPAKAKPAVPARQPISQAKPVAPAPPVAEPLPTPEPEPVPVEPPPPAAPPEPVAPPVIRLPPAPVTPVVPVPPTRPALRDLPTDLVIDYAVQIGDGDNGFVAGRAAYHWHSGQGRYSMVSTVQATGLTALFGSGRIVQVSQGRLDAGGLQPEQYWLERGSRKQDAARFDWSRNQLVLSGGEPSQPLRAQAQDLLSFPFQLALTVREDEPDFMLWVTNGRNFRDYAFHVLGRETVNIAGGQAETVHLQGARAGEGTLDVWLDRAGSGLPIRIRTVDQKGKTMVLRLEKITAPGQPSGG